ncbi:MAG: PspC domain-containing protein [Firmicutes bacterium]|nr:PspC domain-containing protein [Bacillota bacterium]
MKRLYRSRDNQMLGGVCMGVAHYFAVDVTLVRLVWVVLGLWGGIGLPAYIIAWIIIPEESAVGDVADLSQGERTGTTPDTRTIGLIVVAIGLYLLLRQFIPHMFFRVYFWPLLIVAVGIMLMFGGLWGAKK